MYLGLTSPLRGAASLGTRRSRTGRRSLAFPPGQSRERGSVDICQWLRRGLEATHKQWQDGETKHKSRTPAKTCPGGYSIRAADSSSDSLLLAHQDRHDTPRGDSMNTQDQRPKQILDGAGWGRWKNKDPWNEHITSVEAISRVRFICDKRQTAHHTRRSRTRGRGGHVFAVRSRRQRTPFLSTELIYRTPRH